MRPAPGRAPQVCTTASRPSTVDRRRRGWPSADAATDRLGGSLAAHLAGAAAGVAAVRVHDARETVQALDVWTAISKA